MPYRLLRAVSMAEACGLDGQDPLVRIGAQGVEPGLMGLRIGAAVEQKGLGDAGIVHPLPGGGEVAGGKGKEPHLVAVVSQGNQPGRAAIPFPRVLRGAVVRARQGRPVLVLNAVRSHSLCRCGKGGWTP